MKQQGTIIISVIGLVLAGLTACVQIAAPEAAETVLESAIVIEQEGHTTSTDLAANPELMIVGGGVRACSRDGSGQRLSLLCGQSGVSGG